VEAEADVVGGPVAVIVTKNWCEQGQRPGEGGGAVCGAELVEDSVAEGVEPGFHAVWERGRARYEVDGLDFESCLFE